MVSEAGSTRLLPPPQLDLTGINTAENWRRFKHRFELFLISEEKDEKSDRVKIALLLQYAGECVLDISYKARVYQIKFFVLDERNRQPILGRAACELLGLVKRVHSVQKEAEEIFEEYKELFQGLDCLPGKHSIDTDECLTYSNRLSQSAICTS
ncbi:hypothetical protein CAPTEDRAFT_216194 [Capitella teleta]|uniref:Uncharacterized protein n=1 Tax=Capitella teleta TaxID=283909 RepID=R7V3P1_CAPTE|nr:hypothetical protein CAPTEDRAFT_216194 [Capitella teleta]|eukprot:ELU13468.1 hypothetical protein CAPTEDRAFT_216194 [Capitella teleta]